MYSVNRYSRVASRVAILAFVLVSLHCQSVLAQDDAIDRETLHRLKQATVYIKTRFPSGQQTGSGFLLGKVKDRGFVATNAHVVLESLSGNRSTTPGQIDVVFNSGTQDEFVLRPKTWVLDQKHDLAILEVQSNKLPKVVDSREDVEVFETMRVVISGFPFGEGLRTSKKNPSMTINLGTVSSIRRAEGGSTMLYQLDGSINPGNSGGPVVDEEGNLIGVAVAHIRTTQIGFAIPRQQIRQLLLGKTLSLRARIDESDNKTQLSLEGRVANLLGEDRSRFEGSSAQTFEESRRENKREVLRHEG